MIAPAARDALRASAAFAGVAGALALTACGGASAGEPAGQAAAETTGPYADGTYTAEGSYATPETVETISVTVTLESDVVTAVEVTGDPQRPESEQYQGRFIGGISDEVVGRDLDEIAVTRVAGSSLTSGGFMQALEAIKADAAE
ncbi:FMN-binding protein [Microbacterium aureliae]